MKKLTKILMFGFFVFLAGGIGSFVFQGWIFPEISSSYFFAKYPIFKGLSEKVTIVNKTEQVTVAEESSVNKISSQAEAAVVNIISISEKNKTVTDPFSGFKNGTGVIVTSDGLIATYREAIAEIDARYKILLSNGYSYDARLVGVDDFSNLAFLKIETSNLSVIPFANSDDSSSGKKLIAIGNSFKEYQNRYATGILSNINKTFNISGKALSSSEKLEGVFETDFLNQKEYLGGPVINYNGEMVGIIGSVKIDNEDNFFQIPSNTIKKTMDLAVRDELKNRPYLGIYYISLNKAYAAANNLDRDKGAIIYSPSGKQGLAIISGSPAEKAGLKINDIITQINGQEINLENPLSNLTAQYKKGDVIELLTIREGQELKMTINL